MYVFTEGLIGDDMLSFTCTYMKVNADSNACHLQVSAKVTAL